MCDVFTQAARAAAPQMLARNVCVVLPCLILQKKLCWRAPEARRATFLLCEFRVVACVRLRRCARHRSISALSCACNARQRTTIMARYKRATANTCALYKERFRNHAFRFHCWLAWHSAQKDDHRQLAARRGEVWRGGVPPQSEGTPCSLASKRSARFAMCCDLKRQRRATQTHTYIHRHALYYDNDTAFYLIKKS